MKKAFHKDRQNVAQQGRMVQKQVSPGFLDPAHEWRRIFAETWGKFNSPPNSTGDVVNR